MKINDIYDDLTKFWNNISPFVIVHFSVFFLWFVVGGITWEKFVDFIKNWKPYIILNVIFKRFDLSIKSPLTLLTCLLLYLTIVNTISSSFLFFGRSPTSFSHNESDFIFEAPIDPELIEIVKYTGDISLIKKNTFNIEKLLDYKNRFITEQKLKWPDKYQNMINWAIERNSNYIIYYRLFLTALVISITIVLFTHEMRVIKTLRYIVCLIVLFALTLLFRQKSEQGYEAQYINEKYFVFSSLSSDTIYQKRKLNSPDITDSLKFIFNELHKEDSVLVANRKKAYRPWLSRYLEKNWPMSERVLFRSINSRKFLLENN
ncbi:MAG: hypothetical protein JST68_12580 [Bacteroidetes bacterium]|nr:hypothetical protein [Bacteroidota bacterium]